MPVRASRRPSHAPAFPFPPPGPPGDLGLSRDLGLPVASPWAQRLLQAASPRGRESGERLPGSRGGPCVPGQGSAEPSPSRRPARFRSPSGPSRTHEAAARPFPLPIRSPRARAAFRAPRVAFTAPGRAFTRAFLCSAQALVRVRGLSRRADSALGLPLPWRSWERPGDAALLSGRLFSAPPGAAHKGRLRAPTSSSAGGRVAEGPVRPLCSRLRGGDGQGGSCLAVP